MYPLTNLLSVSADSQALMAQIIPTLRQLGCQVVQSFNLQTARLAHSGCSCPHHGTDQCSCQMAVFLVYGKSNSPLTLILHSRDEVTEISLVDDPALLADHHLANRIRHIFHQQAGLSHEEPANSA